MKHLVIVGLVAVSLGAVDLHAQARGRGTGTGRGAAPPRTTSVRIAVHDRNGASLEGVRITLSGDATGEFTTAGAGTVVVPNVKDGLYRIRVEKEGFITLEREFSTRGGAITAIEVVLNEAPPPPPPPRAPEPAPAPAAPSGPPGSPITVSIPDFLDRNFIGGRDPIKESILACKPSETVRLLQMRENVAPHAHDNVDEIVYVVAGEGAIRLAETMPLKPGSLVVVPRGTTHAFERHGRNPLIVISTMTGAPCTVR